MWLILLAWTGIQMTIPYEVKVEDSVYDAQAVERVIDAAFAEVDAHFNNYNSASEVSLLNRLLPHESQPISPTMTHFLRKVDALVRETNGCFDPSLGHWSALHWEGGSFRKERPATLDFGGVAKGYLVDQILTGLQKLGLQQLYVCWGGEIATCGRIWRIAIQSPEDPSQLTDIVELRDSAIATSGDYLQVAEHEGKLVTHITDPRTGVPLAIRPGSVASVSFIDTSCMRADAWATALMVDPRLQTENKHFVKKRIDLKGLAPHNVGDATVRTSPKK